MSDEWPIYFVPSEQPTAEELVRRVQALMEKSMLPTQPTAARAEQKRALLDSALAAIEELRGQGYFCEERVSAGWLRECGVSIPAVIPDVATVPLSAVHFVAIEGGSGCDRVDLQMVLDEPFRWFDFTITVDLGRHGASPASDVPESKET